MTIRVKFFASLRERLGRDDLELPAEGIATVADVWARAVPDEPLSGQVLMSVNMEYAQADRSVRDGDEVAFFPPVTGGAA
ncbi:MAG: MoaD/ThiS family protein [Gammaproteobacteria bacterium]|nr:MoaD/ThiS family protein [Gammaproteobacteria bacterium]